MRNLSKSKIIAFRQCPKRLWLEVHHPELREDSAVAQARFAEGHRVGDIARTLYDPKGVGATIDVGTEGFNQAFKRTKELLAAAAGPIFEAGLESSAAIAFADVMIPVRRKGRTAWKMVEVKSSTSVKDYHREDVATQALLAKEMGIELAGVAIAHIDTSWTYPGGGDYRGLLAEVDVTKETLDRLDEVREWIRQAQTTAALKKEPNIATGDHCYTPFTCCFCNYCNRDVAPSEFPVDWLPRLNSAKREAIKELSSNDLRAVPPEMLNEVQNRVRHCTVTGTTHFDRAKSATMLAGTKFPAIFLDFETVAPAIPVWAGTQPYKGHPFQYSLHILQADGSLEHREFLDLSGGDPAPALAEKLVRDCGTKGSIFVYNASFERSVISKLAAMFPKFAPALSKLLPRMVDLLPIARQCYYHPSQCGTWSIKAVLPAAVPHLSHASLDGVQDGNAAMEGFSEAIRADTTPARREELRTQLLEYCKLDTLAMVELFKLFRQA